MTPAEALDNHCRSARAQTKERTMRNAAVPLDTDSKTMSGATANLRLVKPSPTARGAGKLAGPQPQLLHAGKTGGLRSGP